jgi:radical SAM protein with 4Fe4S-binding SPASM domain
MNNDILNATKEYCGAVAISAYEPYQDCFSMVQKLSEFGIKTNIHYLLSNKTIDTALKWLRNPPKIFENVNAIIFLNYKPVGKNKDLHLLFKNNSRVKEFFELSNRMHPFKIGFDSCSISGIARYMNVHQAFVDYCEAARFSMFISEDMNMYPCSFMVDLVKGIPITSQNIQKEWRSNPLFVDFRKNIKDQPCRACEVKTLCNGGCPIFPEINLCP